MQDIVPILREALNLDDKAQDLQEGKGMDEQIPLYHTNPEIQSLYPINREDWLNRAVIELGPMFRTIELTIPPDTKVSCGWPSRLALSRSKRRIGECWVNHKNIFVSPYVADTEEVLGVLVHELIHACLPLATGHKSPFPKYCKLLGLEGKPTATTVGDTLSALFSPIVAKLGNYPHSPIDGEETKKKQTTRLRLYICECPVKVRVASDEFDATCNVCGEMFKQPDQEGE